MSKVKNELEELSLPVPRAEGVRVAASARRGAGAATAEGQIDELKTTLARQARRGAGAGTSTIDGRIKRLYSIWQKLKKQKIDLDQVYDFVALRIITHSVKDCYAALGIIHHTWSPVPGPHQGLHRDAAAERLPVAAHVGDQRARHCRSRCRSAPRRCTSSAEEGIAAHWKYKEGRVGDQRDERYFQWMRQLLEWQQEVRDPQEFIHNLKIDLYPEEVYIFTPRGEVKALPRGATPVDFAYAIHTDVGHQCVGARVNGKMVPLRTRLKNGDIVEIITQAGHTPSRDWLNFVVTSRARQKIRHFVQLEEKARSIELGRKLFDKDARRFDLNPKTLRRERRVREGRRGVRREQGRRGDGRRSATASSRRGRCSPKLVPAEQLQEKAPDRPRRRRSSSACCGPGEDRIKVSGVDDLLVYRARCCNPIRGEKIVGYISRGKGVAVHAANCPNVVNLLYDPERRIDVEWEKGDEQAARYTVRLTMQVEDRKGILADVSAKVADINTNITSVEATHRRGSPRPDQHDGRDQRPEAPREGDEVAEVSRGRAGGRAEPHDSAKLEVVAESLPSEMR